MTTLARHQILAPLAAPLAAVVTLMQHLRDSWLLALKLRADARAQYPHMDF